MAKFRKKPVAIEAMQFDGSRESFDAIVAWSGATGWVYEPDSRYRGLVIPTLEGDMEASPGDWIIRGVKGELYPCKPDIFAATYDLVDDAAVRALAAK